MYIYIFICINSICYVIMHIYIFYKYSYIHNYQKVTSIYIVGVYNLLIAYKKGCNNDISLLQPLYTVIC